MSKFNIGDMEDKMLEICDEILDEKWDSSCDINCGGVECENCFFGDTFEVCDNRNTEMFKYLAKSYKDKHSNKESNKMEKTFKEIIIDWDSVKEGEVWKNKNFIVSKDVDGDLKLEHKDGFYDCSAIFLNPKDLFELQRKQYTFEEAFRSYEEGKEIESCETGARFIKSDNKDMLYDPTIGFTPFGRSFNIDEIRAKWYVNNK